MPTQDGVGREHRPHLLEHFASQQFTFDGQSTPLGIVQQDSLLAVNFPEDLVLRQQVADDLLLLPIDPAGENDEIELPRLKYEVHD